MANLFLDNRVAAFMKETDAIFVPHTRFEAAYNRIGKAFESRRLVRNPLCIPVGGPTGVGKSTLRHKIREAFKGDGGLVEVRNGNAPPLKAPHRPLVEFEIKPQPTIIRLQRQLLAALGDPAWTERDTDLAYERIVTLMSACRCDGVLMDEAQRLVDRNGEVVAQAILDWFKQLAEDTGVAIVFLGLGRMRHLFDVDSQIKRRWAPELRLEPYAWPAEEPCAPGHPDFALTEDQSGFFALALAFEDALPLRVALAASVRNPDFAIAYDNGKRFFYASRGATGWLKKLWVEAVSDDGGHEEVTLGVLEAAYERAFRQDYPSYVNPFGPLWAGQLPPPIPDDTLLLRTKVRRLTKAERRRDLNDALSKS